MPIGVGTPRRVTPPNPAAKNLTAGGGDHDRDGFEVAIMFGRRRAAEPVVDFALIGLTRVGEIASVLTASREAK
jgi:hypothetical protein